MNFLNYYKLTLIVTQKIVSYVTNWKQVLEKNKYLETIKITRGLLTQRQASAKPERVTFFD